MIHFYNYSFIDNKLQPAGQLRGRLTERLLAQGLLTPSMLLELRKEWGKSESNKGNESDYSDDENDSSPFSKKHRRISRKFKKF